MKLTPILFLTGILISTHSWSGEEGMPKMPRIQPKRVFPISSGKAGEGLLEQRGYGDKEPMVRMMNLMMVGGSGYEGMDMSKMDSTTGKIEHDHTVHGEETPPLPKPAEGQTASYDFSVKITPDPPKVGTNILTAVIQRKNDAKPAQDLKVKAQIYMTSMDMGTEEPSVRETAPGTYQVKVVFSMKGPWAVKLLFPEEAEKVFHFEVGSSP